MMNKTMTLLAVIALVAAGCDREPADEGADDRVADTSRAGSDTSGAGSDTSGAGSDTTHTGGDTSGTGVAWVVSTTMTGPIRIGMSAPDAGAILGVETGPATADSCYYIRPKGEPQGVLFMVTNGRIARVDVKSETVATAEGARIGDSEERIMELYPGRVRIMPHEYEDGHYLIVTPADSARRIVFETDGRKVTRYRAGMLPEVEWVEGCS